MLFENGDQLLMFVIYGGLTLPVLLLLVLKTISPDSGADQDGRRPSVPPAQYQQAPQNPSKVAKPEPAAVAARTAVTGAPVATDKKSWAVRLQDGLRRTRGQLVRNLDEFFISKESKATREDTLEKLFELLIQADVGVRTSELLVERVRDNLRSDAELTPENIKSLLRREILAILSHAAEQGKSQGTLEHPVQSPHVVMMVGVNGVGKTTTTGKLAFKCFERGQRVAIGAADTFRAAAVEQLAVWADRAQASLVRLKEGTDPASVAFETVRVGKKDAAHVCIVDTAGRLHNRNDLMQELAKIRRVMAKEVESAPHEVLLVIDATTGQNALMQARTFKEVVDITGLVVTKLDGTAKGGVAVAVAHELQLPIRYVGVGESVDDLEVFSPDEFVNALFAT